jgi:hypothetical protein
VYTQVARAHSGRLKGNQHAIVRQSSGNQQALRMPSSSTQHAISMPSVCPHLPCSHCNQYAISMQSVCNHLETLLALQSVCNQYAISMQSACNQHAISMPSPRTPARAAAFEGARAWVHPAADRAARRPRRAGCRRRCTPPEEGGNQHAHRDAIRMPSATALQAGGGVLQSEAIRSSQKQSEAITSSATGVSSNQKQSEAIRSNQKQSPPPLLESQAHRGHDGGGRLRQYRRRSCTQARSSGRLSREARWSEMEKMSALGGNQRCNQRCHHMQGP